MGQSQSTYEDAIDKILRPSKDESVNVAKIAFSGAIEDTVTYMRYTKSYNIVRTVMKIHRNMILRYFKLRYSSLGWKLKSSYEEVVNNLCDGYYKYL